MCYPTGEWDEPDDDTGRSPEHTLREELGDKLEPPQGSVEDMTTTVDEPPVTALV